MSETSSVSKTHSKPELYVIVRITNPTLDNAIVRVSRDVASAHALAQAFLLNQYVYTYTNLSVDGVQKPPLPSTVYLVAGLQKPGDLKSIALGAFSTMEDAEGAVRQMHKSERTFVEIRIFTCPVQFGLSEEDDEYISELNEIGLKHQLALLEQESQQNNNVE